MCNIDKRKKRKGWKKARRKYKHKVKKNSLKEGTIKEK